MTTVLPLVDKNDLILSHRFTGGQTTASCFAIACLSFISILRHYIQIILYAAQESMAEMIKKCRHEQIFVLVTKD